MSEDINNQISYESILKQVSQQGSKVYTLKKTYPAYLVLIIMLVLSFFVYNLMDNKVKSDTRAEFDKAKNSLVNRLENSVSKKTEVLTSMSKLYDLLIQVVRDYFELYGSIPIKTNPDIRSISYIPNVKKSYLSTFLFNARSEGYYEYKLHPTTESNAQDFIYPIEHIVPFLPNEKHIGYDFASNKYLKEAIESVRDSVQMYCTQTFRFDHASVDGFYIISPIFEKDSPLVNIIERRKHFYGSVAIEVDTKKFFESAFGLNDEFGTQASIPTDTTVIFEVMERNSVGERVSIFKSPNFALLKTGYSPAMSEVVNIRIANRKYQLKFYTVPNFGGKFQTYLPVISLVGSLILSFVFFGFILQVVTSKSRAIDLAERMTRSQRRIVESSKDIIAVMDYNGIWRSMNGASLNVLEYSPKELIGESSYSLFHNLELLERFKYYQSLDGDEFTERLDIQMISKNNEIKWINWSFTFNKIDGYIYSIGRDVTLEKLAEEQAILKSKQIQLAELYAREASESKNFFMIKMSHQLRNSLTSIIGYLQLVDGKFYETEEELSSFAELALSSSEEIFTFVSDIVDATLETGMDQNSTVSFELVKMKPILENAKETFKKLNNDIKINYSYELETEVARMLADKKIMSNVLADLFDVLSTKLAECEIIINAQENTYEGATEIQLLVTQNEMVEPLIKLYKEKQNNLIEALKYDQNDVLLKLSSIASIVRRLGGVIKFETMGKDGNLVMINLPMNKETA